MSDPTPLDGIRGPTAHLTWAELAARRDPADARRSLEYLQHHAELWPAAVRVAELVEAIRAVAGHQPIRVTCGLRPGDELQHGSAQALDVQIDGVSPRWLARVIRDAALRGALPHPVRQVLAETLSGEPGLDSAMRTGGGGWVHVAVMGLATERWSTSSQLPVGEIWHQDGQRSHVLR